MLYLLQLVCDPDMSVHIFYRYKPPKSTNTKKQIPTSLACIQEMVFMVVIENYVIHDITSGTSSKMDGYYKAT